MALPGFPQNLTALKFSLLWISASPLTLHFFPALCSQFFSQSPSTSPLHFTTFNTLFFPPNTSHKLPPPLPQHPLPANLPPMGPPATFKLFPRHYYYYYTINIYSIYLYFNLIPFTFFNPVAIVDNREPALLALRKE